jgi:hypothetical protein
LSWVIYPHLGDASGCSPSGSEHLVQQLFMICFLIVLSIVTVFLKDEPGTVNGSISWYHSI